jgi:hypothetical protein
MTDSPPPPPPRSSGLIRVGNFFLAALRRLLYLVVRTRVTPETACLAQRRSANSRSATFSRIGICRAFSCCEEDGAAGPALRR